MRFHVDDLMSSHLNPIVNTECLKWLNEKCGTHGAVKATRGHIHDCLGMTFDFSDPGKVKVDMIDCMTSVVDAFPKKLGPKDTAPNPAPEDLFAAGESDKLTKSNADDCHTFVAKALFACKRA